MSILSKIKSIITKDSIKGYWHYKGAYYRAKGIDYLNMHDDENRPLYLYINDRTISFDTPAELKKAYSEIKKPIDK